VLPTNINHETNAIAPVWTDTLNPSQSPHGANFLPHLPSISAEPQGMDPFPEALEQEYADYLRNVSTNRSLLTSRRRWEMREILNHLTTLHILSSIAGTGDVIWVQRPQARRRRTEPSAPNSSPSAGPAARSAARAIEKGGRGSRGGRVTRSMLKITIT
jgi:hypothetical protein